VSAPLRVPGRPEPRIGPNLVRDRPQFPRHLPRLIGPAGLACASANTSSAGARSMIAPPSERR
jgi:hypothetical protein